MTGHVIVVDLGYGDAGKGGIVDWLCSPAGGSPAGGSPAAGSRDATSRVHAVVRFNGGAQAAHHVLSPGGSAHCFAQFGSGTFRAGVRTFLSRFMLVDPLAMTAEAAHLAALGVPDPFGLVTVDREALLTTPYHQAANRAREAARGAGRHGSCGMGIGETASYALRFGADAPRAGDCAAPRVLQRKLVLLRDRLIADAGLGDQAALPPAKVVADAYRAFAGRVTLAGDGHLQRLLRAGPVVFEGAQGVLLDEWRGFHPYTTWSTTTFSNAEALLADAGQPGNAVKLGVTRCYLTRHGPGPLVTEDEALVLPEPHNGDGRWQGPFRTGHLDAVALRYATRVCGGVDAVALTHLDIARRYPRELKLCRAYLAGGQRVARIVPGPDRDLAYQEGLTRMLLSARPVYDDHERIGPDDWPHAVAEITGAPVAVRSYGPAAAAKAGGLSRVTAGRRPAELVGRF
jgi:adenylosuccinate synthase